MPIKDEIVFLDTGSLDYGDLDMGGFHKLGSFKSYEHTSPKWIYSRVKNADIVISNKCSFDEALIRRLKKLKSLHITATGVNNVDLAAAKKFGVAVTNVVGYSTESMAQFTLAYILGLAGSMLKYHKAAHDGTWSNSKYFTLGKYPSIEVSGKTLGIIGYGNIGKRVAQLAGAFGMKVLIAKIPGRKYFKSAKPKRELLRTVVRKADFLSIHAPMSPLTKGLISSSRIKEMKRGSFIINVGRGEIVDENALARNLRNGHLGGAASDVLSTEPPPKNHVLLNCPNMWLTPHVAWATRESRKRLLDEVILNIQAAQKGKKRNRLV